MSVISRLSNLLIVDMVSMLVSYFSVTFNSRNRLSLSASLWVRLCLEAWLLNRNCAPQLLHLNGISPVCSVVCSTRLCFEDRRLLHILQVNAVVIKCFTKVCLLRL